MSNRKGVKVTVRQSFRGLTVLTYYIQTHSDQACNRFGVHTIKSEERSQLASMVKATANLSPHLFEDGANVGQTAKTVELVRERHTCYPK